MADERDRGSRGWQIGGRRHELKISTQSEPGVDVVALDGEFDGETHEQVRRLLRDGDTLGQAHVVLDLSGVSFIDSSGLGAIVVGHLAARSRQASLRLVARDPHIVKLLALTTLSQTVPVHASRAEALTAIG